jgi:hypothetical protein
MLARSVMFASKLFRIEHGHFLYFIKVSGEVSNINDKTWIEINCRTMQINVRIIHDKPLLN